MSSPTLTSAQKSTFDRILVSNVQQSDAVARKSTPALFFGVTTADGPIYIGTAGTKFMDDPTSEAITEDTVFWVCSQTKLVTSVGSLLCTLKCRLFMRMGPTQIAALQLIEQGKIELDSPVETVLPELANPVVVTESDQTGQVQTTTPAQGKITFGQLLNHSSGLDYWVTGTPAPGELPSVYTHNYKDGDVSTFFKILKARGSLPGVPLKHEPGTGFGYGFSSDCLGFAVERISGKSLEQYLPPLRDRLLLLSYRNKSGVIERWNRPSVIDQDPAHVRVHLGGVGLYASQKDYLKLLCHLLQIKADRATSPILSHASVDSLFTPTLPPAAAEDLRRFMGIIHPHLSIPTNVMQFSRGLLVNTADVPEKRSGGSGAWSGYATTSYFVDPTAGVAAVLGTQLLPPADETYDRMYGVLEKELYAGLERNL
ncbi:beta-lactamase [Mycena leptocephala]|nr:beta-lactamase [Mycena leptocephala]